MATSIKSVCENICWQLITEMYSVLSSWSSVVACLWPKRRRSFIYQNRMQGDEINFRFRCRLPLGGLPPSRTSLLLVVLLAAMAVMMMIFPYLYFLAIAPQYARLEQFPFNFSNLNRANQSNSDFLANYYTNCSRLLFHHHRRSIRRKRQTVCWSFRAYDTSIGLYMAGGRVLWLVCILLLVKQWTFCYLQGEEEGVQQRWSSRMLATSKVSKWKTL